MIDDELVLYTMHILTLIFRNIWKESSSRFSEKENIDVLNRWLQRDFQLIITINGVGTKCRFSNFRLLKRRWYKTSTAKTSTDTKQLYSGTINISTTKILR